MSFLCPIQAAIADDAAKLFGTWKLISFDMEFQDSGKREPIYGQNPTGYIIFLPEGRMMTVLEKEGRAAPKTDQDRAVLLSTMVAYTGMYRIDGDKWTTKIDASWNPLWNGTEQIRFFKIQGGRLDVIAAYGPSANFSGRIARGILSFERVK
jgi:hypothetical protein